MINYIYNINIILNEFYYNILLSFLSQHSYGLSIPNHLVSIYR